MLSGKGGKLRQKGEEGRRIEEEGRGEGEGARDYHERGKWGGRRECATTKLEEEEEKERDTEEVVAAR